MVRERSCSKLHRIPKVQPHVVPILQVENISESCLLQFETSLEGATFPTKRSVLVCKFSIPPGPSHYGFQRSSNVAAHDQFVFLLDAFVQHLLHKVRIPFRGFHGESCHGQALEVIELGPTFDWSKEGHADCAFYMPFVESSFGSNVQHHCLAVPDRPVCFVAFDALQFILHERGVYYWPHGVFRSRKGFRFRIHVFFDA
mmetsp:Transcript_5747/g.35729  ORF Transcript_5747/g.35729 Transcript_5747/m.35729 type:complete len:200 (-) Transcript_5747:269-868(-)